MARAPKTQTPEIEPQEPQATEPEKEHKAAAQTKETPPECVKPVAAKPVTDNEQNRIISRILRQNRQERTMQKYAAKNRKLKQEVKRLEQEVEALRKK